MRRAGQRDPAASIPCEIHPSREFYDYEDKYELNLARTDLPPNLARMKSPKCAAWLSSA
jgi:D-alanine-D-alanine ligase-like ATP-grasp enzyme